MESNTSLWTYIKNYKFNSLFFRNFLIVLFLLMVPLAVVHALVYSFNQAALREEIGRISAGELTRIRDNMDMILTEAENLSIRIGSDPDVEALVKGEMSGYPLPYASIARIRKLQDMLRISILTNPYVEEIELYNETTNHLLNMTSSGMLDKYAPPWWAAEYRQGKDEARTWISTVEIRRGEETSQSIVLYRQLVNEQSRSVLVISIGAAELEPLLREMTPEQQIYIVDQQRRILYARDNGLLHAPLSQLVPEPSLTGGGTDSHIMQLDGIDSVVTMAPSSRGDWTYLSIIPLELYESRQDRLYSFILLLVTVGIVSSLVIAFLISIRTYRPIQWVLSLLDQAHSPLHSMLGKRSSQATNELKYIATAIGESLEKSKQLEEELGRRYELMSRAQSIALQAQINPHMLYNTLEGINWKVMRLTGGKNEASMMLHALSKLLRLSLATGENVIPLRDELEHARLYVEVQQLHFKEELEVIWKINGAIQDHLTVKLTLQPIIENAIHHGIRPSGRQGVITITGYEESQSVVIKIKDNGVGIPAATAERINAEFRLEHIQEDTQIGLRNVNQRLKLIFGPAYGLRISGVKGEGTLVEMRMPRRSESRQ
ncbi:sensor histidine kinase [Paenibacillus sp. IB182496]|uniref:Sensor histidine kinase n=1 Tax=Paenibacillus sabuli TaxID=2772509 RepID=A0A927BSY9_9BACL|nr:sensor histidine kinase [Paenibacillus sabuli]MBD2845110.1 sensor histidine kinase [Paenibacillus sabuli]